MKKRVLALLTALCVLLACGASAETVKHERVFAVTDSQGNVTTLVDNVRLENGDKLDTVADRTMLTDVQNVSGHETFTQDGENLTWQLNGASVIYQGTSDKAMDIAPVVRLTVDGQEVSAEELANMTGEVTIEVTYTAEKPYLALTVIPLDENMTDVTVDNGTIITDGSRNVLVGWAVPGLDERAEVPASFTVKAQADHAELDWMMTLATAQPVKVLSDELADHSKDAHDLVNELTDGLNALKDGKDIAEGDGDVHNALVAVKRLFDGVDTLKDGAASLKDGAVALNDGAATLETGLTTLTENNDALNQGASQLFTAVLTTANQQLAAAGLDAAGITMPELTADNYAAALDTVLAQLDPEALTAQATEQARTKVQAAVEKQESAVRKAVEQAVEAKVLEGVLAQAGMTMTAEDYQNAVSAGKVTHEQSQQISKAVEQMMGTDDVKAQLEAAVTDQINALVEQNLASDDVQAQIKEAIAPAQAAYDSLKSLKDQLDSVNTFVTGLATYTAGVAQAASGSTELHSGATQLSDGATQLSDGVVELDSGLAELKAKLTDKGLDLLSGDVQKALDILDATESQLASELSYDLVADGMSHDLLYIIRTQMK